MSHEEVLKMMEEMGLPFAYDHFVATAITHCRSCRRQERSPLTLRWRCPVRYPWRWTPMGSRNPFMRTALTASMTSSSSGCFKSV